ncbi:putative polyketide synthase [Xylariaceae sp. FL1019]|nr:putative polyketide synthase [Xylariaceae sp. FL1019]
MAARSGPQEPIALIGSACRFAGSTPSPSKLWELLSRPRDVRQEIPAERFSANGFYHSDGKYHGHSNVRHGYFLDEDVGVFDAEFFGIRPAEARAMDPQQRMLLEVVYEALESAGIPMADLRGSDTAVFVGSMTDDYGTLLLRDIQDTPDYYATGVARSILSNRISYVFDWHGPSISVDTACSSSLVAVHMAVQTLRAGESRVALACGANIILGPESFIIESKLGMLSPEGRSRMWDQGANGYARGEGVATLIFKTLSAALEDGDHIECIIRETGLNQDGATAGITMPSAEAQAALIRKTYARAGLDLGNPDDRPQFFEAHGTGTPAGDPIEAQAIHSVFGDSYAKTSTPLYVGSIKTILGHTEGTAGLAGVLKASLAVQHRSVPPNMLFENLSDRVAPFYKGVEIPLAAIPWPSIGEEKICRASVNSFGFGGANAHAIVESFENNKPHDGKSQAQHGETLFTPFVFSAFSQPALVELLCKYADHLRDNTFHINMHDLAWTLRNRRSVLSWREALTASSVEDLCRQIDSSIDNTSGTAPGVRGLSETRNRVLAIFTGQGAQYAGMGSELVRLSPIARDIIAKLESYLQGLPEPPSWSLSGELMDTSEESGVHEAAIAQPLCTAVQIMLVDLLRLADVRFEAVVGHSSGEIGAAYAAGYLTARDAMAVAYYRGVHLGKARSRTDPAMKGAMVAVGTTPEDAADLCKDKVFKSRIVVAAVNSPTSVTISGDEDAIGELEEILQDEGKFHRRLRVDKAYHSPHMNPCSDPYIASLQACGVKAMVPDQSVGCSWFSSVHGRPIQPEDVVSLSDTYWAKNLTSPVLFSRAVAVALTTRPCDLAIEVGPNPTLRNPVLATAQDSIGTELPYQATLVRRTSATQAMSSAIGDLWSYLGPSRVDMDRYERSMAKDSGDNRSYCLVKGLPTYPWKHDTRYWHESRVSRKTRMRPEAVNPLIGHPSVDSAPHHLVWRHVFRVAEMGWLSGHQVQGQVVFPAAGYVCAAIEAASSFGPNVRLIEMRDFVIHQAITFDQEDRGVEVSIMLADVVRESDRVTARFTLSAALAPQDSDDLSLIASCQVAVKLGVADRTLLGTSRPDPPYMIDVEPESFYSALSELGYHFSGCFRSMASILRKHGESRCIIAPVKDQTAYNAPGSNNRMLHPARLDAALQSIMLAHAYPGDGTIRTAYLPTTIRHITVNPWALNDAEDASSVTVHASIAQSNGGVRELVGHANIYVDQGKGHPDAAAVQIQGATFKPLGGGGGSSSAEEDDKEVFFRCKWINSSLDGREAARGVSYREEGDPSMELLERISVFYLRQFDRDVPGNSPMRTTLPTSAYLTFARHITSVVEAGRHKHMRGVEWLSDTLDDVLEASRPFRHCPDVQMMHLVGSSMPRVFAGDGTMLEYFRNEDILDRYYANGLSLRPSAQWIGRTVKQIVDRHQHMNMLEIGAGTGSATKAIFKELPADSGFSSYTYTDISAAFFKDAKEAFTPRQKQRMLFKTLNVETDPVDGQGYSEGAYDLVVCFFVLHATSNIGRSLRHIRKLLRPGGYLVVGEGQDAWEGTASMGFIFGTLPGWWVGASEGRVFSPYVSPGDWDGLLRDAGFSGIDTSLPPELQEHLSVFHFVTQAVDDHVNFLREPLSISAAATGICPIQKLAIVGGSTPRTSALVRGVQDVLFKRHQTPPSACYTFPTLLDVDYGLLDSSTTVLSLTELDAPVFKELTAQTFEALKPMFHAGRTLLWATSDRLGGDPYSHMTVGFGRVAANETPDLRLQQLDIADPDTVSPEAIATVVLRFAAGVGKGRDGLDALWTVESEVALDRKGREILPRLEQNSELNNRYNSDSRTATRYADHMSTLVYLECQPGDDKRSYIARDSLQQEQVTGLSSFGLPSIHLRTRYSTLAAFHFAGGHRYVVVATDTATGQEYLKLFSTPVPSEFIASRESLIPYPEKPSCNSQPAYLLNLGTHLAMTEILGHVHGGQTMLVHNAGQPIALIIDYMARMKEISVIHSSDFPRTGDRTTGTWIRLPSYLSEMDIQDAHLPPKISAFVGFSPIGTPTFDNEERLVECLTSRCQIFKRAEDLLTLTGSDPTSVQEDVLAQMLSRCVDNFQKQDRRLTSLTPTEIGLGDVLGKGVQPENTTAVVVDWTRTGKEIPIAVTRLDSKPLFKGKDSTYWIVGISRDLGIMLADWMIRAGAMNLVITSRNPKINPDWIAAHKENGMTVEVVPCDVTNKSELERTYSHICGSLPPIAGVIQGAMVLHDTLLRDMTFEQYRTVAGPKVDGSANLDALFSDPARDLDFFVLVSSITAVMGNVGQANYAAANAFMCGLAAQRRRRGLRAAAVDIGVIVGAGYRAREKRRELDNIIDKWLMIPMSGHDWCQAISEAIEACRLDSPNGSEVITGLKRVAFDASRAPNAPNWCSDPKFSHLVTPVASSTVKDAVKATTTPVEDLGRCKSQKEAYEIVEKAFAAQLRVVLQITTSDQDLMDARGSDIGLDSLVSVDIRTWFLKSLQVNIPVLRIMSNTTSMASLVQYAVETTHIVALPTLRLTASVDPPLYIDPSHTGIRPPYPRLPPLPVHKLLPLPPAAKLFSSTFRRFPLRAGASGFSVAALSAAAVNSNTNRTATISQKATRGMTHNKVVIIGSGPAAHTAAIYLARAELKPVLYEGFMANGIAAGGQLTTTTDIENFPGFPKGIMGGELMDDMKKQSERFGTTIISETISKLDLSQRPFKFETEWSPGVAHTADAIILATGASAKRLGLNGEEKYWQAGVSACAVCDGAVPIFRNKPLVVIGGGDSAAEEATFLTKYGSHVTVLVRRDQLRASNIMASRLLNHPKVTVRFNSKGVEIKGDGKVMTQLVVEDTVTGKQETLDANGLFYAIGHDPATNLVKGQLETDSEGYVVTKPGTPCTSIEGVFAAGDVQDKRYRQAITSAGTGCMAAMDAEKFIADMEVEGKL